MKRIEIAGRQIGWLTVIEREPRKENSHRAMYRCRCKCGIQESFERGKIIKGEIPACTSCRKNPLNAEEMYRLRKEIVEIFDGEKAEILRKKKKIDIYKEMYEDVESRITLSDEQSIFIEEAMLGKNILVEACIGSGKTTAIQELCNLIPQDKKVLYLTYNRLLKIDAKKRIKYNNVTVTNYHGYAYMVLASLGVKAGISDLIQTYLAKAPKIEGYDVLIIDEYQDIEQELADMLELIKSANPLMQIIAVGDMQQKIYDKTTLNVERFINCFLEKHERLEFTKCFRLSSELATKLGRVWRKSIIGVNKHCHVEEMSVEEVIEFLKEQDPEEILCLGARGHGKMLYVLNELEEHMPDKFNKNTVYASIADVDRGASTPKKKSAIFTTFDSSKGLERPVCVVFDYTERYWEKRIKMPQQDFEILRNIFCVAASRGKRHIIFVNSGYDMISEKTLSTAVLNNKKIQKVGISEMFNFKYKENIEKCFSLLKKEKVHLEDDSSIEIKKIDGMIDLTPCIGIFQEASFFKNYNIDFAIEFQKYLYKCLYNEKNNFDTDSIEGDSIEEKILYLTSLETYQQRYRKQVSVPFVENEQKQELSERLKTMFSPDEIVQVKCEIPFFDNHDEKIFTAIGICDVIKDEIVYELKFVSELTHEHFLQCACYIIGLGLKKGVLWNTRNNQMYSITIPDKKAFMEEVAKTVVKNNINDKRKISLLKEKIETIAVIDVETNWNDDVMSIGIVIADSLTYRMIKSKYYIFDKQSEVGGMYSSALYLEDIGNVRKCSRRVAMDEIIMLLRKEGVSKLFAYNAHFDKRHLPELDKYGWYDIMKIAAYRQYNTKILSDVECHGTGRLKKNYGVQSIMRMLSENPRYIESHNAIRDAEDELKIMRFLDIALDIYDNACIKKVSKELQSTLNIMNDTREEMVTEQYTMEVENKEKIILEQKSIYDKEDILNNKNEQKEESVVKQKKDKKGIFQRLFTFLNK